MTFKNPTDAQIEDVIQTKLEAGLSRKIDGIVTRVNALVKKNQEQFFTILAQKIIGATSPPDLGPYTPVWAPLTAAYTKWRLKKKRVARNRFYEYRSRRGEDGKTSLKELLQAVKSSSVFGAPLVYKSKQKVGGRWRNSIAVDLYPKVSEFLSGEQIDEKRYFQGRNRGIAWRVRNWQGTHLRPIMQPYMLWWMNIKMTDLIRREVAKR